MTMEMKDRSKQETELHGLLADEINAIVQYVSFSGTCDTSGHAELHTAIMRMHDDFPGWLQQRIAFMDRTVAEGIIKEGTLSWKQPAFCITKEKVPDPGKLEIGKDKEHHVNWQPIEAH